MNKVKLIPRLLVLVLIVFPFVEKTSAQQLPDFTKLVEKTSSAVVNISTKQTVRVNNRGNFRHFGPNSEEIPEIFRRFFGEQFEDGLPNQQREKQSLGSGFIISKDGYILTNYHVVADADEIFVRLIDRRELEAKVIGTDQRSDLALLKINASNLPTVRLGDSDKLKVGEWVLAIGSPFNFDYSVTAGIVSAKGRSLPNENYVPFIQTDVAINPGNSGGPLFNLDGEVVGINSQIFTRSGGFMGLSFAIPVNVAMDVVDQLKTKGSVSRGWLGVAIQEVNRDLAESFGLKKPGGALVVEVMPGSPAEKADLQEGDIILKFNGKEIDRSSDLPHIVGRMRVGEKSKMVIIRDRKRKAIKVKIGALPTDEMLQAAKPNDGKDNNLGLVVSTLSSGIKSKWDLDHGVLVRKVNNGPARNAGLRQGDVITMLNNQIIDSVKKFNAVVTTIPRKKAVPMRIVRRGNAMFLPLKLK